MYCGMSSEPEPRIPPELCDMIIDNLHDDPFALGACALACRAWVSSARTHQFHTIILPRYPEWRAGRLSLLSDHSSTVLPYVRCIGIGEGRGRERDPYWLDAALQKMRIRDLGPLECVNLYELDWDELSLESLALLHALCARAKTVNLEHPHLLEVSPLLALCQASTAMEQFILDGGGFPISYSPERVTVDVGSFALPPNLRTLEIAGFMWPFLDVIATRVSVRPQLRSVYISSIYQWTIPSVLAFLRWCGAELEELTLLFNDPRTRREPYEHTEVPFSAGGGLAHNTALRTLNLEIEASFAADMLQTIASRNIQTVSISTAPSSADSFDFSRIAALFSRRGGALSKTKLRVLGSDIPVEPLIEMRDKVYRGFADLRGEGRVEFERAGGYSMDLASPPNDLAKWGPAFPSTPSLCAFWIPARR